MTNCENYNSLSMPCLIHMLKNFSNVYFEEKKPIIAAMTKQYFEDKNSVNLYSYILYYFKFRTLEERLNYILIVLGKELEGDINDLPMEYREDFFRVLLDFLSNVENYAKNQKGTVEWQLSNIPKLLDYLSEIEKADITSYSLRQKINSLVIKIKEDFEKTKNIPDICSNTLVSVANTISVKETEEKLNQIKTLKLQKSKLNKGNLSDALSSFELYSDGDKEYLVNYMFKHNWLDCMSSINSIVAFDFFSKNTSYSKLTDYYNPFKILCGAFSELQNRFSQAYLDKWFDYFGISTFDDLMLEVEKWYMRFNGSTQKGWDCYKKLLLSVYLKNTRTYFMDSSELAEYSKKLLLSDCDTYLTFFNKYRGKTLLEWTEKVDIIPEYVYVKVPTFNGENEIVEDIKCIENQKYLLSYYYEVYEKYSDKLFHYHGNFTNSSKVEFDLLIEEGHTIYDFLYILNTVIFDGETLVTLKNNKTISSNSYGHWTSERSILKDIMSFIQGYFCQNSDKLSDEFIKDLWFDKEHYLAFCHFTNYHNFSGAFKDQDAYSYFFFDRIKDDMNFNNLTDLKLFFRLQGNYYTKSKMFTSFYEKFQNECSECYNILNNFMKGKIEGQERDIIEFIKLYYQI